MRVQDVMTQDVRTISAADTAEAAYATMKALNVHHLVVHDGDASLVGVVSMHDLGAPAQDGFRRTHRVADVMSTQVVTAEPDMTIRQAANLMRGRSIGCLPVVQRGRTSRLVGILTRFDLLGVIGQGVDGPVHPDRRALKARAPRTEPRVKRLH
ncbi:MAG TPA: CBS domain-containing protein [Thermoanaerobaculia bacterium]|nr:CBS domain-containing protein [Thermoanaerobaculia bacterium]